MAERSLAGVGLVAALDWEAAAFRRGAGDRMSAVIETCGPGPEAAEAAARRLVGRGARLLVSWGSAGALGRRRFADVAPGEIVLADAVVDVDGTRYPVDAALMRRIDAELTGLAPLHRAPITTSNTPVASPADKQALADRTGAIAVDMESGGVARVAAAAGLPVLVVRVIVDSAGDVVPDAAIAAMDGPRIRIGRIAARLLESPSQLALLIRLAGNARRARRVLVECARRFPDALIDVPGPESGPDSAGRS